MLGLALGGVRASTAAQLVLVALLIVVVVVAVAGSAPRPGGQLDAVRPARLGRVGRAASTLMLSFVGWEAVAPLTARFRNPGRQLPRVIGIAFGTTALLYLGLAVATSQSSAAAPAQRAAGRAARAGHRPGRAAVAAAAALS